MFRARKIQVLRFETFCNFFQIFLKSSADWARGHESSEINRINKAKRLHFSSKDAVLFWDYVIRTSRDGVGKNPGYT